MTTSYDRRDRERADQIDREQKAAYDRMGSSQQREIDTRNYQKQIDAVWVDDHKGTVLAQCLWDTRPK
jgi:hypothetical protein